MTPKVEGNKDFAKWLRDWIEVIQQNRASGERIPPEKTASTAPQAYSDGAPLLGAKRRAAFGEYVP
jgi:hypothetical protein